MAIDSKAIQGVWRLDAWDVEKEGTYHPRAERADGLLIYTPTGHMSVTITSDGPGVEFAPVSAPPHIFYAGTYEVRDGEVIHHAQLSFDPKNFTNVHRRMALDGDTLELRTPAEEKRQVRLIWKRIGRL